MLAPVPDEIVITEVSTNHKCSLRISPFILNRTEQHASEYIYVRSLFIYRISMHYELAKM